MFLLITLKKPMLIGIAFIIIIIILTISLYNSSPVLSTLTVTEEHITMLDEIFKIRNKAFLEGDLEKIESLYNKRTTLGKWAYEHQSKKNELSPHLGR